LAEQPSLVGLERNGLKPAVCLKSCLKTSRAFDDSDDISDGCEDSGDDLDPEEPLLMYEQCLAVHPEKYKAI